MSTDQQAAPPAPRKPWSRPTMAERMTFIRTLGLCAAMLSFAVLFPVPETSLRYGLFAMLFLTGLAVIFAADEGND